MNIVKKRNPDPQDDGASTPPPSIPALPALRTFFIRGVNHVTGEATERIVNAHGLALDEARMLSFIVFFLVDGNPTQTPMLLVNADAWTDVEEINPLFPLLLKH